MGGNGREVDDKDRGSGVGTGYAVQDSRSVGVIIWEQDLSGDKSHAKITRGIKS